MIIHYASQHAHLELKNLMNNIYVFQDLAVMKPPDIYYYIPRTSRSKTDS